MEISSLDFYPRFYGRLLKLYLPLLFIGGLGLAVSVVKPPPPAQAAPVSQSSHIVYTGVYEGVPTPVSAQSTPTVSCLPDSGFSPAGPISASSGQTGIIERSDPVYGHQMYGYTPAQLDSLSRSCPLAISGDSETTINAYTSYWIGWKYDYDQDAAGLCTISNPAVLLHLRQALPVWADYAGASRDLQQRWQTYSSAVASHENGHVQLIKQAAGRLLDALRAQPATDCSTLTQAINRMGADYLAQLADSNEVYDQQTRHGAAQGAIVP